MAVITNEILPTGEHPEPHSLFSYRVTQYASDKIRIQGIPTFGYRKKKGIDSDIPWHYHRNRFEFHYLIQGSLSFVVGEQEYALQNGDVFVTFPNELHKTGEQNVMRQLYWFSVEDDENILGLGTEWSQRLMDGLRGLQNRIIPVGGEMKALLKEVFENIVSSEPNKQMYASLQMGTALYKIIEYDRLLMERRVSEEICLALDFIEQNKDRNILLEEVAERCHLSLSHFKLRFKRETGSTPAFYIQKKRIDQAKELLKTGHSVTETAHALGFCSSDYFSTVFRRITLTTPSQYIQKIKNHHET